MLNKILDLVRPKKVFTRDLVAKKYRNRIGEHTYGYPIIMDWDDNNILLYNTYRLPVEHKGLNQTSINII